MEKIISVSCVVCGYHPDEITPSDLGMAQGNTERFKDHYFQLWKCPKCLSILSIESVEMKDIYQDYPPNRRRPDIFSRGTLRSLFKRLQHSGLTKDASILDFGCGNGLFIDYLMRNGHCNVTGHDPYFPQFAKLPKGQFDWIILNDVIEHVEDPKGLLQQCTGYLRPGGKLYVGTADSEKVNIQNLEHHLMALHQPFHRVILTEAGLHRLAKDSGLAIIRSWRRSYMDTLWPFVNYRFLDEFNRALNHNMDRALDPASAMVILKRPQLFIFAFFGYFFPSAFEPAVLLRNNEVEQ